MAVDSHGVYRMTGMTKQPCTDAGDSTASQLGVFVFLLYALFFQTIYFNSSRNIVNSTCFSDFANRSQSRHQKMYLVAIIRKCWIRRSKSSIYDLYKLDLRNLSVSELAAWPNSGEIARAPLNRKQQ